MNGLCDVQGCNEATYLGWRPLTERRGRQICEFHWLRHKDEKDSFDLYDEFKFRRPKGVRKPAVKKHVSRCVCGRELLPGRRFCMVCAAKRKRQRNKRYYHGKKANETEATNEITLKCRQCGGQREVGHTYCPECAKHRKTMTRRQAQSRYWKKQHIC